MRNPFALLGLPESLLLDPASVETAWRDLSREGQDGDETEASALNHARTVLADPVSRLAAWLEVMAPGLAPDRAIAPSLMDLFSKIGPVLATTDAVLARHRKATTALARAMLAKEAIAAQLAVQDLLPQIQSLKTALTDRFGEFEAGDFKAASRALGQLKFLKRWEEQCRERLLALIAT